MKHNKAISSTTLNELCLILGCNVENIISFEPTDSELKEIQKRKKQIIEKFHSKKQSPKLSPLRCLRLFLFS